MTTRPSMADLANRRAPALHRTLPTWARERKSDDCIEYRMYAPHPAGGTLFISEQFTADTSRAEVAARLRILRAVIWGRDKQVTPAEAARKREARAERMALNRAGATAPVPDDEVPASGLDAAPIRATSPASDGEQQSMAASPTLPTVLAQTVGEAETLEQQGESAASTPVIEVAATTQAADINTVAQAVVAVGNADTPHEGVRQVEEASAPTNVPLYAQQSLF